MTAATVLLVPGAWCGDWVFWKLAPQLEDRGIAWIGTDLPSCQTPDASVGPLDDVVYVRGLIEEIDGPVVVAGKSYGGTVITGATVGCDDVAHLVYIAAMMPEPGELFQRTTSDAMTPEFARGSRLLDDGRIEMDAEVGAACAFGQATEEDRDVWRRNRRPMSFGTDVNASLEHAGWLDKPSTYVVCTEDKAIQPRAQRAWASRATHVIERPWDHSPGVSHPSEVADLLAHLARSV